MKMVFGFVIYSLLVPFFGFLQIGRHIILVETLVGFEALGA